LTEAGTVLGTAAYISPEQATGLPATPASDVYSFGVLLFRMLTGALPFVSEDPLALVVAHRDEPPPLVTDVRPDAPPALAATADAALAKDPAGRPADGAALLDALAGGTGALAADTDVTRVMPAVVPPRRRSPLGRAFAIAFLAALALAGGVLAYEVTRPAGDPRAPATTLPSTRPHTQSTPTTTRPATTRPATTEATTTSVPSTTRPTTTIPTTTHPATTTQPPPTTSLVTTTTYTTTTAPATTDTTATTTAAATAT
jgi:eukaryotic-like serine/threonine-protein kinase